MEEIKEVKPKKKRPRPEGAVKPVETDVRPKKKRPRPEGADAAAVTEARPKKKRPVSEEKVPVKKAASSKREELPVKKAAPVKTVSTVKDTSKKKKVYRRGRRKKKKGGVISTIILIIALCVFAFSVFNLVKIFRGYQKGSNEYEEVIALAVEGNEKEEDFKVNFDELLKINKDTVGWIRFFPEPAQINYPVVQGPDNDLYLNKTFSANDNTVGAIFVNVFNNPDFNDMHTIVYGHRMNDNSMFHDLAKYADKTFWESNPYFYIYTPDGRKIAYHIYAAGEILETSPTYNVTYANAEEFQTFLDLTLQEAAYATGVEVDITDEIVTLSTCVKGKDEARFVVRGVKDLEVRVE